MKWHYGVIRTKHRNGYMYGIHEIFTYNKRTLWTDKPITPYWNNVTDLIGELTMMKEDITHYPVYEIKNKKLIEVRNGK